jgi:hypothetical protein
MRLRLSAIFVTPAHMPANLEGLRVVETANFTCPWAGVICVQVMWTMFIFQVIFQVCPKVKDGVVVGMRSKMDPGLQIELLRTE